MNHIQRTAPGPPAASAVATPMIFPVPMVAARAVVSAPNCETSPSPSGSGVTDNLIPLKVYFWMNPVLTVQNTCVPSNTMIRGKPHSQPSIALIASTNPDIITPPL